MKFLCISACADPFSYTPMKVSTARHSLDYSMRDLENYIRDYESALKSGQFSRIHIHMIDINPETGEVTVEINRVGENPLKTKKVINPDAAAVREARLARAKERITIPKAPQPSAGFFTTTAGTEFLDDLGLGDSN
jgi:hypothetical protein